MSHMRCVRAKTEAEPLKATGERKRPSLVKSRYPMTAKNIEKRLEQTLIHDDAMQYGLYTYELEEALDELKSSLAHDRDDDIFAATAVQLDRLTPCSACSRPRCRRSEVSGGGQGCLSHIGAADDTAGGVIDSPSSATITLDGETFFASSRRGCFSMTHR